MDLPLGSLWRPFDTRRHGARGAPRAPWKPVLEPLEVRAVPSAGSTHTTPQPPAPAQQAPLPAPTQQQPPAPGPAQQQQPQQQPAPSGRAQQPPDGVSGRQQQPPPPPGPGGGSPVADGGSGPAKHSPPPGPNPPGAVADAHPDKQPPPPKSSDQGGKAHGDDGNDQGDDGKVRGNGGSGQRHGGKGQEDDGYDQGDEDSTGRRGPPLGSPGRGGNGQAPGGNLGWQALPPRPNSGAPLPGDAGPVAEAPDGEEGTAAAENDPGQSPAALPGTPANLSNDGGTTAVVMVRAVGSASTGVLKGDATAREPRPLAWRPEKAPKEGPEDQDRPPEPEARAERPGRPEAAQGTEVTGLQGAVEAARVAAVNRLFAPASLEGMTAAAGAGAVDRLFALPSPTLSVKEDNPRSEPDPVAGAGGMAQPEEGGSSLTARRALAGTAIFVALAAPPLYETLRRFREGTDVG